MTDKRNQPCPCGSGRRYKRCCGLAGRKADASEVRPEVRLENRKQLIAGLLGQGAAAASRGRLAEAETCFRQATAVKPDLAEAHYNLGLCLIDQGRLFEAEVSFRQTLALKDDYAEAHNNLGLALHSQGRLKEAEVCFRRALDLKPEHTRAYNNLGLTLNDLGRLDEAERCFHQALKLMPDYAKAHYNLGLVFQQSGKFADAAACFRKALALKPDYAKAYISLSRIFKYEEPESTTREMVRLYEKGNLPADDRIGLGFALGKIFEDLGNYGQSFEVILEANLLKRKSYEYSTEDDCLLFERIMKTFSAAFLAPHRGYGNPDQTVIFIVGMPRSGTTLIEQILASHPLVYGAGELDILEDLIHEFCPAGVSSYPDCVLDLQENSFTEMGAAYTERIRVHSANEPFITDKLPHNFLNIGLISTILPNAKVINCVRNPVDNCLSIFKNDFKQLHKYAYDMLELGQYYNLYSELTEHWQKVLPGFMHTLRYEELVTDQRVQTEKLLDFCGLPWNSACLDFHKTARKVSTASFAQVRQPLYGSSVELWRKYEKQLEPLLRTLG